MEVQRGELMDARRKRRIQIAAGLFAALLIILTLFSNTIMTMNLPKVRTEQPQNGRLMQRITGGGILQPKESVRMTNPAGWSVLNVLVKRGDAVTKGQVLATFDTRLAARSLEDEQARLAQLKLVMEQTEDQYISAQHQGDELASRQAKRDLENARLNIGIQEHRIQSLQEELERGKEIKAPYDGIVLEANDGEGLTGAMGELVAVIANMSKGFLLSLNVSSDQASLLTKGEQLQLVVKGGEMKVVEGEIAEIGESVVAAGMGGVRSAAGAASQGSDVLDGTARRVVISVLDDSLKGGEEASVLQERPSGQEAVLISNGAIHEDRMGKYVYVLKESRSPLGNTYSVRKTAVTTGGSNGKETAVLQGLSIVDQAIVESGEPLQEGDQVRIH